MFTGVPSLSGGNDGRWFELAGGDLGVEQTVALMQRMTRESLTDPAVKQAAVLAIKDVAKPDAQKYAAAIFQFAKDRIKYVPDYAGVEELTSPAIHSRRILNVGESYGDCDDFSMSQAAWLISLGVPARFAVVASPKGGGRLNHVRVEARAPSGWMPMESTIGKSRFGQSFPILRKKVYEV
jgi:transglutaminase-like putative cysteine protease